MQYLGSIFFSIVFDRLHVVEWGSKTSNIFYFYNRKEFWWMFVTVIATVVTKKWLNCF